VRWGGPWRTGHGEQGQAAGGCGGGGAPAREGRRGPAGEVHWDMWTRMEPFYWGGSDRSIGLRGGAAAMARRAATAAFCAEEGRRAAMGGSLSCRGKCGS